MFPRGVSYLTSVVLNIVGAIAIVLVIYAITLPDGSTRQTIFSTGIVLMVIPDIFVFLAYALNPSPPNRLIQPGYSLRNDVSNAFPALSNTTLPDFY